MNAERHPHGAAGASAFEEMAELRTAAAALARRVGAGSNSPLLSRFAERLDGLLDEYEWEAGLFAVAPVGVAAHSWAPADAQQKALPGAEGGV